MQKKQLLFAGAVLCLAVAGWSYYQYQKPRVPAGDEEVAYTISAEQLYAAYSTNETEAGKKYNDRVIVVRGIVSSVQATPTVTNVLFAAGTNLGGVNCSLAGEHKIATGSQVTIKGRCTGFLMDVNVVDAVLVGD